MKRLFKTAAFILSAVFVFSVTGCSNLSATTSETASSSSASSQSTKQKEEVKLENGKLSLPYSTVSNFNPILPYSELNMVLWPLMYDCVSQPDKNYEPQCVLAQSVNSSGNTAVITLKNGIKFTDGSTLSGSDVKYSLDMARGNTASPYYSHLTNVSSISANGLTVTVYLKTPDPLFANLLDIPIIKSESDKNGNAIGTGRFIYKTDGVNANLTVNKNWFGGKTPIITNIALRNIPYKDAIMTSLSIANINYVYSDYGTGPIGTATNVSTSDVNLNQLVYVGINTDKERLNNPHLRKALSYSLDRATVVSQIYSNHAVGTLNPFNPSWKQLDAAKTSELSSDFSKCQTEIQSAGGAGTGTVYTLLVNSENATRHSAANYIASCFSKSGITVNVKAVSYDEYNSLIKSGNFDMYLGELKISNNMDISPFLVSGGSAAFAYLKNSSTISSFNNWRNGSGDIKSVATSFANEMPFIPVCYHMGTVSYTKTLGGSSAMDGNIFYDFDKWGFQQVSETSSNS